jgi:hypothetical protein
VPAFCFSIIAKSDSTEIFLINSFWKEENGRKIKLKNFYFLEFYTQNKVGENTLILVNDRTLN